MEAAWGLGRECLICGETVSRRKIGVGAYKSRGLVSYQLLYFCQIFKLDFLFPVLGQRKRMCTNITILCPSIWFSHLAVCHVVRCLTSLAH
jgi:hypothetical protein